MPTVVCVGNSGIWPKPWLIRSAVGSRWYPATLNDALRPCLKAHNLFRCRLRHRCHQWWNHGKVPAQMQSHRTGHFVQHQAGHPYPSCRGIFHAADQCLSPLSQTKVPQHAKHWQQQNKQRYIEGVTKSSEKKGTTKNTNKSFSFPSWPSCSSWFKAFMLFATPSYITVVGKRLSQNIERTDIRYLNYQVT